MGMVKTYGHMSHETKEVMESGKVHGREESEAGKR